MGNDKSGVMPLFPSTPELAVIAFARSTRTSPFTVSWGSESGTALANGGDHTSPYRLPAAAAGCCIANRAVCPITAGACWCIERPDWPTAAAASEKAQNGCQSRCVIDATISRFTGAVNSPAEC